MMAYLQYNFSYSGKTSREVGTQGELYLLHKAIEYDPLCLVALPF